MTTNITIKKIDERILRSLKEHASSNNISLNEYIKRSLARIVGFPEHDITVYADLNRLAGTWSEKDVKEFNSIIEDFKFVDQRLWRP